jgi:hypothetical protein
MTVDQLVESVRHLGGVLELRGESVRCLLPPAAEHLASELKELKTELIAFLQRCGGRVATFPRCPRCAGHALYRKNNIGSYECLTCGLLEIEESTARRLV